MLLPTDLSRNPLSVRVPDSGKPSITPILCETINIRADLDSGAPNRLDLMLALEALAEDGVYICVEKSMAEECIPKTISIVVWLV